VNDAARLSLWLPAAVLALGFIVISPVLWSGWTGDDAFYSALNGILGADRLTLWQAMAHSFNVWFFGNGRFYPGLILEKYLVFAVLTNLVAYKMFLIVATLATVELFRRCVAAYTTPAFGALSALAAVALFLVHGYQDALIAYNGMPQAVAIAMLGSFIAFRAFLAGGGRRMAILSVLLYAAAALTYEDVYLLCLLYPVLARYVCGSWRVAIRVAWPQLTIAATLTVFELFLHMWVRLPAGTLYAIDLNAGAFLMTAFYQLTAAFPLAYWVASPPRFASAGDMLVGAPASPFIFAGFALVCWAALGGVVRTENKRLPYLTGILLTVLPALPVALLVKYQQELRLGLGYLPEFFQTFGAALLLAAIATAAVRRFGVAARAAAVLSIGVLAALTYAANVQLVRADVPERSARLSLQNELAHASMAPVPDGAVVSVPKTFNWIDYDNQGPDGISTRGLLYMYGGRRIDLEPPEDPRASFGLAYDAKSGSWTIRKLQTAPQSGLPLPCNVSRIANGDFTFGFRCWAQVAVAAGRIASYPQFRIDAAGACLPAAQAGNPFATLDVPANAQAYIAQTFIYRGTPTSMTFRAWGAVDPVTVSAGIVFPVGTGMGTERTLDTFVAPPLEQKNGACSGRQPVRKVYRFSGYPRGAQIQLRLHATSAGADGAIAAFDDVTSSP
jgi:hypothetical protein